jgi:uncharacterized protein (UPF0548 family)
MGIQERMANGCASLLDAVSRLWGAVTSYFALGWSNGERTGRGPRPLPTLSFRNGSQSVFCLHTPSADVVREFVEQQRFSEFSYPEVRASASLLPGGYNVDRNRILLGTGEATWRRATEAIRSWQMFNLPWMRLCWPTTPIQVGSDVAILVHHFGFCSLNAARVAYVVDEDGPITRFGFAYGTLREHAERGEERFTVEWNRSEDQVWYSILAFSVPNKALARLGYPLSRMLQKKFGKGSKAAMLQAVRRPNPT